MVMAVNGTLLTEDMAQRFRGRHPAPEHLPGQGLSKPQRCPRRAGAFGGLAGYLGPQSRRGCPSRSTPPSPGPTCRSCRRFMSWPSSSGATAHHVFVLVPTGRGADIPQELLSPEEYRADLAVDARPAERGAPAPEAHPCAPSFTGCGGRTPGPGAKRSPPNPRHGGHDQGVPGRTSFALGPIKARCSPAVTWTWWRGTFGSSLFQKFGPSPGCFRICGRWTTTTANAMPAITARSVAAVGPGPTPSRVMSWPTTPSARTCLWSSLCGGEAGVNSFKHQPVSSKLEALVLFA